MAARRTIAALKVRQWLDEWESVPFDDNAGRARPPKVFYLFQMSAAELKALSGINRRSLRGERPRAEDAGIQRRHDEERSDDIREFVKYGYPWCELGEKKRSQHKYANLRKPGWLPTAIIVNILQLGQKIGDTSVGREDLVAVIDKKDELTATVQLPEGFSGADWVPNRQHPIEVIDGQHRLWAFEGWEEAGHLELPVVAFVGLDTSWKAYLFWSINITPKRINASLAFDLYPLLRTEDWLERFEGHSIYRETRSQELTESLWSHPDSPWHNRINMLGERGLGLRMVSQAAWIRALMRTYVKGWERGRIGGLFGARTGKDSVVLEWSRAQQAAFLILAWEEMRSAVEAAREEWTRELRADENAGAGYAGLDLAFAGPHSLMATDQGVMGVLHATNDLCFMLADELQLQAWESEADAGAVDEAVVTQEIRSLKQRPARGFLRELAERLACFDWRSASAPNEDLTGEQRLAKAAYRGGGGYKAIRLSLLQHLRGGTGRVARAAAAVHRALELDK